MSFLIHQPHDKLFKQSMSDIRVAKDFFETYVSAEILKQIDLSTLKLQKNTFIADAYKKTEADVVYAVSARQGTAYLYILCEQQSEIDGFIAFRLLDYTVQLMKLHAKQYSKSPLPLVYPLVVYSGEKVWNAPLDIFELFGEQSDLARRLFLQPYQLVDVNRLSDEVLREHLWSGIVAFALKHRQMQNFSTFLDQLLPWLNEIEIHEGESLAKAVIRYVLNGIETGNKQLLLEKSQQLSQDLRGEIMTIAQQIAQENLKKGIEQGMQQGMRQANQKTALRLLQIGMSLEEVAELTDLSIEALQPYQSTTV